MRIIRFDHISYIAANKEKENILSSFAERKLKFVEVKIENLNSKQMLMRKKDQKKHDLYFFEGGGMDVEVIFYDDVSGKSDIRLDTDTIYAECMDLERTASYFQKIGIAAEKRFRQGMVYNLKGWLGKKDTWLEIQKQTKFQEVFLDDEGYGCVALLVDSLSDLRNLSDERNLVTRVEPINIYQRHLDVCFWKNMDLNIIFEFITAGKGQYEFY